MIGLVGLFTTRSTVLGAAVQSYLTGISYGVNQNSNLKLLPNVSWMMNYLFKFIMEKMKLTTKVRITFLDANYDVIVVHVVEMRGVTFPVDATLKYVDEKRKEWSNFYTFDLEWIR